MQQVENILTRNSKRGQYKTLVYHSAIDPKKVRDQCALSVVLKSWLLCLCFTLLIRIRDCCKNRYHGTASPRALTRAPGQQSFCLSSSSSTIACGCRQHSCCVDTGKWLVLYGTHLYAAVTPRHVVRKPRLRAMSTSS